MISQSDQLPVGLSAQMVEHCIGNAEVKGFKSISNLLFAPASCSDNFKGLLSTLA